MSNTKKEQNIDSDYVVCYVDILGLKKEFKDDPTKAYEQVDFFRETFFKFFKEFNKISHQAVKIEVLSDSLIIYAEYDGSKTYDCIDPILASIVCTFTASLNDKNVFTFRGGMEIGKAKILGNENYRGIVGPVLVEVDYMESEVAKYPRIVLGKQLISMIESSNVPSKPLSRWTTKDMDGIDQINIFCKEQSDLLLSKMSKDKIKHFFTEIAKNIISKYKKYDDEKNLKVSSKWGYLLQYLRQSYIGEEYLKEFWNGTK